MKHAIAIGIAYLELAILLSSQTQEQRIAAVEVLDCSRSMGSYWRQAQAEAKQMLEVLPDGSHCTILLLGGSVRRVFDGTLNPVRRAEALRQLDAASPIELNTDLAAALTDSFSSIAGLPGRHEVWIYSDGGNRPAPKSPYRGKTFQEVLAGTKLQPDVELFVRLYGNDKLQLGGRGIAVFRSTPDWKSSLHLNPPPLLAQSHPAEDLSRWLIAACLALALFGSVFVLILRLRRAGKHSSDDMGAPIQLSADPDPPAATPVERLVYMVQTDDLKSICLEEGAQRDVTIGDHPLAELTLPKADQAWARLELTDGRVILDNCGEVSVWIGRRKIPPHRRQELPTAGAEILLGRHRIQVLPETVVEPVGGGEL